MCFVHVADFATAATLLPLLFGRRTVALTGSHHLGCNREREREREREQASEKARERARKSKRERERLCKTHTECGTKSLTSLDFYHIR